MATPTNVTSRKDRWQFQGMFSEMWVVEANINWGNINSNSYEDAEIPVAGLHPNTDMVLCFNREDNYTAHALIEVAHVHAGYIHLLTHNTGGGSFNAPDTKYRFIVVRLAV